MVGQDMSEQVTPTQTSQQQPPQQQSTQQPPQLQPQAQGTSGLAIVGLVLGVIAIATSFVPIVNNVSLFIAIIGLVLSFVGKSQVKKGAKQGGGIAVAGIVLSILAIVITLMVQAACSAALDSITSNESGTVATTSAATSEDNGSSAGSQQADTSNMTVGQTVNMNDGMSITVNSVTPGLVDFDGSTVMGVSVTYVNNGSSGASFNLFDWKAEDANGAQRSSTIYTEGTDALNSGTLSPGGSVTGNIYFDEPVVKVYYYSNLLSSDSNIAWVVA